jgi:hypothetical protein
MDLAEGRRLRRKLCTKEWLCQLEFFPSYKTCLRFALAGVISLVTLSQELEVEVLKSLDDEKT